MSEIKTIESLGDTQTTKDFKSIEQLDANEIITAEHLSMEKMEVALKESLSVIHDVREELANAYRSSKTQQETVESLTKEFESVKLANSTAQKTIESLSTEIGAYKAREAETERLVYNKRLEKLSEDFRKLGQEKTVEQLSKLGKEVINEFEAITTMALSKRSTEKLNSPVTTPTQGMPEKKKESLTVPQKAPEQNFFLNLANALNDKQKNTEPFRR